MKSRFVLVLVGLFVVWMGLVLRLIHLQVLPDKRLSELHARQFQGIVSLKPRRGSIFDRNGKELAGSLPAYSIYADPKMIKHSKVLAKKLSPLIGLSKEKIISKLREKDKRFVWLVRSTGKETADKVRGLGELGLGIVEESRRVYPQGSVLAQVIGFVGREENGLEGLERKFDADLKGESKNVKVERDARGRPLLMNGQLFLDPPSGLDVTLTIDSQMQFVLEKALSNAVVLNEAASATGIILDAKTSEILAMGNVPGFNLNSPFEAGSSEGSRELWRNKCVTDAFEPGSTIKTLVVAGALKRGIAKPSTKFYCEDGSWNVGGHIVSESDNKHKFGDMTLTDILARSSNIGIGKLALEMGDKTVRETLLEFGIGEKTQVELPGEAAGVLQALPWREHLLVNTAFGQGMMATPLQIAVAYAAIANGGILKKPIIVKKIYNDESKEEKIFESKVRRQVLTADQANTMRLMLMQTTIGEGTGKNAQVPGYPVAGKTGTAQKVIPGQKGYAKDLYVSSFVGFIPANNPEFVIFVAVDSPRKKYYGSEVAAPVFAKVASYVARQSGLPPVLLSENDLVENQKFRSDQAVSISKLNALREPIEVGHVPDWKGLTLREVLNKAKAAEIDVQITGSGEVYDSIPAAGEELSPETRRVRVLMR